MTYDYVPVPSERYLSLDPMNFGFGYIVIEFEPLRLIAWGTKTCRRQDNGCLPAVNSLVLDYQPTAIVMPDWREVEHEFRGRALDEFIESIAEALTHSLPVLLCTPAQVREHFGKATSRNKDSLASHIAKLFPELRTSLPPRRLNSDREREAMCIFDALSMALAVAQVHVELPPDGHGRTTS